MSRILALAAVAALLAVSACKSVNQEAPSPSAAQPAPEADAAPGATGMNVRGATVETPATAVKPVSAMPEAMASEPVSKAKPAKAAPAVPTREQALALAAKGNCLICHKIDSKLVGPAWKDVGAKYKGDANAASTLAAHIKSGGSFGWKFGVMPPRGGSTISDSDVASLAKFIAALK